MHLSCILLPIMGTYIWEVDLANGVYSVICIRLKIATYRLSSMYKMQKMNGSEVCAHQGIKKMQCEVVKCTAIQPCSCRRYGSLLSRDLCFKFKVFCGKFSTCKSQKFCGHIFCLFSSCSYSFCCSQEFKISAEDLNILLAFPNQQQMIWRFLTFVGIM